MAFWNRIKEKMKFTPLLQLLAAAGIAFLLTRFPLNYYESFLYDARVRLSPLPSHSEEIVLIAIDRKTLDLYGHPPETVDYSSLLLELSPDSPHSAVFFRLDPNKWKGTAADKQGFVQIAGGLPGFFFGYGDVLPQSQHAALVLPAPFENLIQAEMPDTRDGSSFAQDKVSRRTVIAFEGRLTLQAMLASSFNKIIRPQNYRGTFEYFDSIQTTTRYHQKGAFERVSFIDVANGRFPQGLFRGKIVLIGNDNELDVDDYSMTPLSRHPLAMSKLEIMANNIATLIHNNGPIHVPSWLDFLLTTFIGYVTLIAVWTLRPVKCIGVLLVTAVGIFALSWGLFAGLDILINTAHPLLAIFVCYYFFIPYRLILENKTSWEYYQKNKLLTQVEELKTNFLSMMSHDLKTPLARIQGMAETAMAETSNRLSPSQRQAMASIVKSSEELGAFISSILDLSRIESKEVKLQKTSKDINSLLKEIIKKYQFAARAKNISLKANLEPLFSASIDVDLMRQVLANLVENAIKYSPENTIVTVSSAEQDGKIQVSVQDQGPGIPQDELENIFLKFYRSKSAKASPIKGSGLGLYLAKYFVDLHGGQISVQSAPSEGSTFSIHLPV